MKIKTLLPVVFFLLINTAIGQSLVNSNPKDVGFSTKRLGRIDALMNNAIKNNEIPGAVVLIARNNKIAYQKSYGYSNIESKERMKEKAIFRIASMTKAITTAGIMILYERGHFLLNDPISKYLPEFKNPHILIEADSLGNVIKSEPTKEIRIIDLLTHSSGLSYPFMENDLQKVYKKNGIIEGMTDENVVLKDKMNKLATLPILFEPGSKPLYGLSTDLLGRLCEVISKKSFAEFLSEEIFIPLKMKDTYFYLPQDKEDRLVTLYTWSKNGLTLAKGDESGIKVGNPNYPIEGSKSYFSGGAGLSATAYDFARFLQMLLNNGELDGVRILGRKSVELMQKPRIDWDNDGLPEMSFSFKINQLTKTGEIGSNGTYSWGGAFYTFFWVDPTENLVCVLMSQVLPSSNEDLNAKFNTAVYQALE